MSFLNSHKPLNAVTATTTSGAIDISDSKRVSIYITASAITSGNGVFTVELSADGTNWVAYNRIISNVTNTNGQEITRVASVTLSANGSEVMVIDDIAKFIRVKVTRTTDGTYTAKIVSEPID